MNFPSKTIVIMIALFLLLSSGPVTAQDARVNPETVASEKSSNIDVQLKFDIDHMQSAFENASVGINSTDKNRIANNVWMMDWYYRDYKKNLAIMNDTDSVYNEIDSNFSSIMNTTMLIIQESEDSYNNYKVLKLFEKTGDNQNREIYAGKLTNSSKDLDSLTGELQSNVSNMKKNLGDIGFSTGRMDNGVANIRYYKDMVGESAVNPTVGLGKNYAPIGALGIIDYQQIYDYYSGKDQPLPDSLKKIIVPPISLPMNLTVNASNNTAYYGETVEIDGRLTTINGTPLNGKRVYMVFDEITFSNLTDENGEYHLSLMISEKARLKTHNISIYAGPFITRDSFLIKSWSPQIMLTVLPMDTDLTIDCPEQMYNIGDNLSIRGRLTTENGVPIKGADVQAFTKKFDHMTGTISEDKIGNNTTDLDGSYNLTYQIPESFGSGDYALYTVFSSTQGTVLEATTSDTIIFSINMADLVFELKNIPLIYFKDDVVGIKGRMVTANGYNVSGREIRANLSEITLEHDVTDTEGIFTLSHVVADDDTPGLKKFMLWSPESNKSMCNMTTVGNVIVIPYDKTVFLLIISIIVLSVPVLAVASSSLKSSWMKVSEKHLRLRKGGNRR